jgi:hypothetical protein
MRRIGLSLLVGVSIFMLSACGNKPLTGNGKVVTKSRQVADFNKVEVVGTFDIRFKRANKQSVSVTIDSNIEPYILTKVTAGTLLVTQKSGVNFTTKNPIIVTLSAKQMMSINSSGANDLKLNGLQSDHFALSLRGAGDVIVSGKVTNFDLGLSGTGDVNAAKLITKNSRVMISGAGKASVYATEKLDASISGIGNVTYYGDPDVVTREISGMGSISAATDKK